jgi:CubicO group peptidase (beta-lactamase class C family)
MTNAPAPTFDRRAILRGLGASSVAIASGCAGLTVDSSSDVIRRDYQRLVDTGIIPGAVILVGNRNNVRAPIVVGWQDIAVRKAMREDTIFRLYSMSKPITSVAIMMLIECGKIALDQSLESIIPSFRNGRVYVSGDLADMVTEPVRRPITISDLLTHASGLTYHFGGDGPVHRYYRVNGVLRNTPVGRSPIDGEPATTLDVLVERLSKAPLIHHPGEMFEYSYSTTVLGAVIERVSGLRLDVFLRREVFAPLDMRDTTMVIGDDVLPRFITNYSLTPNGIVAIESPITSDYRDASRLLDGGGAIAGTARDYYRFARLLAEGGAVDGVQLLKPESVQAMLVPRIRTSNVYGADFQFGYGLQLGTERTESDGGIPAGAVGWSGSGNTFFWSNPVTGEVVVVMTQSLIPAEFADRSRELRTIVAQALHPAG